MKKVFIIAEAGVNHNGDFPRAIKMIDVALEAGADAIKFQTFKAERIISPSASKAKYQLKNTMSTESQLEMLRKFELSDDEFRKLQAYCSGKPILFLSTPFDLESIDLLCNLGMEIFKIPSGEITNSPYLKKIGKLGKTIILSTGMANLGEIEEALDLLVSQGTAAKRITLLHCNTEYPTPMEDVNLRAMLTIKAAFQIKVGYSDHTMGLEVSIAAAALGASVIEKHFTLDRKLPGPDHSASLEPQEFKMMVQAIRNIEKAMGLGLKVPSASEVKNKPVVRKSLVAAKKISKGETFDNENIAAKRPGTGISPMHWDQIIGQTAKRNYREDEQIEI